MPQQYDPALADYRLSRKLAAPVQCETCDWVGQLGDLAFPLACPECGGVLIDIIAHDPPVAQQ
jgi:hypothetical protein